nr:uncharacterized protein LOC109620710 [Crassostrea gigas]
MCLVGKPVIVKTDVVDSDIPLLLSRTTMKKAGVKLDLEKDTAVILGQDVSLNLTTSGHYCIPVDKSETLLVEEVNSVKLEELEPEKGKAALLKLHRQFAHPPKERLAALLKDAGAWMEEFEKQLLEIEQKCDLCKVYAKTPPRPIVSMPMAKEFNEKVAMDLKQYKGRWILHMIDMWSRYTVSVFIQRKRPSDVIDAMMKYWVGVFGVMGAIMSDNGGEFSSDEMREKASILIIRLCTTAGMSPYQNGLCERVHAVTDMMLTKLEDENKTVNIETLLAWANMARNSLQMWNGFSSHQLIFGQNPNLPNIMKADLPALEGSTSSETLSKRLNTLHEARRAFILSEADERIRRALRTKVRAAEEKYDNGDLVFYKREGRERWLGPGKVVFQDRKVVFVRHGGVFVRVSPNRLCKIKHDKSDIETDKDFCEKQSEKGSKEDKKKTEAVVPSIVSETLTRAPVQHNQEEIPQTDSVQRQLPRKNDKIKYKLPNSDEWTEAKVLGRAGKATGRYPSWFNVRNSIDNEDKSVDLDKVEWKAVDEEKVNIADINGKASQDQMLIEKAKQTELEKLHHFDTFDEVEDHGQKTLSTRWVLTGKDTSTRARLVARGFEEHSFIPSDSPTVGKGAIRIFLAVAGSKRWIIKTTDIKSAFLQGNQLQRDVYIKPPKESDIPVGFVWKLKHGLYGLKDGARQIYMSVRDELLKLGCNQSKMDPAVFTKQSGKRLTGIVCCHVDDFLHAGEVEFEVLLCKLKQRYLAGKVEETDFQYIGFHIKQRENKIMVDHSKFMDKLDHPQIDPIRAIQKHEKLTNDEQTLYRKLVGQLNWAVQGSRPDLAFELVDLSTKLKTATVADLLKAIKTMGKLKDIIHIQIFPLLHGAVEKDWEIFVFTDAALANISEGEGSTGGQILWIKDRIGNCCPIHWQANKIKRVVRSTIAAEALSLQEGLESALYYRKLLEEICHLDSDKVPITAFVDNKSVVEALKSTKMVDDKRLRIDIAAIKEIKNNNVLVKWIPGKVQLANCLTKRGADGMQLLNILQTGKMPEEFT